MGRFKDFDEALAERHAEPIVVRIFGRDWQLPGSMPAAVPLKVARWMVDGRSPEADLSEPELLGLAADLIPGDVLSAWFDKGLDIERLGPILVWIIGEYTGSQGEAPAPVATPGQRTASSSDGGSSKPTSDANIDSLSRLT